jgi:hypothetical protein
MAGGHEVEIADNNIRMLDKAAPPNVSPSAKI